MWFYHDYFNIKTKPDIEYLKLFEKKYSINLWSLAYNERIFYRFNDYFRFTENEVMCILEQECKLYEKILDEIKSTYVIMSQPPFHHTTKSNYQGPWKFVTQDVTRIYLVQKSQIGSSKN